MVMSTMQLLVVAPATVNCHWTPVSFCLSTMGVGLPPNGSPAPINGIIIVLTVEVMSVSAIVAWAAYDPAGPLIFLSLGFATASPCALSLVAYCIEQPVPVTEPLMSNWMPV